MSIYYNILFALLAIVKFLFTPFTMMAMQGKKVNVAEIISTTGIGATVGVLLFYYGGTRFFKWWNRKKKPKRVFTPNRRRILRIKHRFGLAGIVAISGLISVPVSAVLAARFFKHNKLTPLWLILGFWLWAFLLSAIAWLFKFF